MLTEKTVMWVNRSKERNYMKVNQSKSTFSEQQKNLSLTRPSPALSSYLSSCAILQENTDLDHINQGK